MSTKTTTEPRVLIVHAGRILGIHDGTEVMNLADLAAYPRDARVCSEAAAAAAPWLLDACTANMGDPQMEDPDRRRFPEVLRHLASLMEEKRLLTHMAKPTSQSAAGWAKLLKAKADQIEDALKRSEEISPRSP